MAKITTGYKRTGDLMTAQMYNELVDAVNYLYERPESSKGLYLTSDDLPEGKDGDWAMVLNNGTFPATIYRHDGVTWQETSDSWSPKGGDAVWYEIIPSDTTIHVSSIGEKNPSDIFIRLVMHIGDTATESTLREAKSRIVMDYVTGYATNVDSDSVMAWLGSASPKAISIRWYADNVATVILVSGKYVAKNEQGEILKPVAVQTIVVVEDGKENDVEEKPTKGSKKLVDSNGIYNAINDIEAIFTDYQVNKAYLCGRKIGTTISQEPSTLNGWKCIAIPVVKGDIFELYGYNGYSARLWCFVDEDWKVVDACQGLSQLKKETVVASMNGYLLSSIPSAASVNGYTADAYIYKLKRSAENELLREEPLYCMEGISFKGDYATVTASASILEGFSVVKGHRYLLYLKSDALISDSETLSFGMGSNGNFDYTVTPQQLMDGVAITKTCGTAATSRIYTNTTIWHYGVKVLVRLIDEDEPELFPLSGTTLHGNVLTVDKVVDALGSDAEKLPLSARQGGVLKGMIEDVKGLVEGRVSYIMREDYVTTGANGERFFSIPLEIGHRYRIHAKSDVLAYENGTTAFVVGIDSHGQRHLGDFNTLLSGLSYEFTAKATLNAGIFAYSPRKLIAGVKVHFEIKDLAEPSSIGPFNVESSVVDRALAYARTEGIPEEACNWKILWTRSLANNMLSFSGFQPSTYNNGIGYQQYASMTNYLTLPYRGVRIYLKAPYDITARVIFRPWNMSAAALSSTTIGDGEYVDADADAVIYVVEFYRRGECFPPQELYDYMDEGLLMLYYHDDSGNVVVRNSDEMRYVNAIRGDGEVVRDYATFVHGTDVHGDEVRLNNILRFANLIKPTATLLSGDHVAVSFYDGIDFFNECLEKWRYANPFICIGNHDSNDVANDRVFAEHVEPLAEKFGWMKDAENVTDSCWFYKDITDKKIRLISLDMYEYGGTTFYKVFMQQAQIDWFIQTLKDTPEEYAVLIVQHSMERQAVAITGKEEWWGTGNLDYGGITGGYVIQDIMDAWIGKTTINKTYTQPMKGGATNTFTAEADFSEDLANEFIGYVCGHTHVDCIGYAAGTVYRQLIMCCTCACPWRGQTGRVYPRGLQGVTQDSFNVYAVDRTNKQVRIAKVGSNMKMNFTETKYTIVDYDNIAN